MFLYFMSLRTGTSLATLTILLNKVSGIYGLLAILTGQHLSPLQFSMYIYSLLALALVAHLAPHIRSQSPLECLALAWFYVIDSVINAAYTAVFAVTWFLVVSQHLSPGKSTGSPGLGGGTVNDTAGFTSPKYNVSHVDVVVSPASGLAAGQDAVIIGSPQSLARAISPEGPSFSHGFMQPESLSSAIVIIALWIARLYLTFVVLSYARFVLQQHMASISRAYDIPSTSKESKSYLENPFASHLPAGFGWKGKLGRAMVGVGQSYWLGINEREQWKSLRGKKLESGPVERERRRRSGTGPSAAAPPVLTGEMGQYLRVTELKETR